MAFHGYQEIKHTADLALRVWGEDFESLLESSAEGLYALMGVVAKPEPQIVTEFHIENSSLESILVDFLGEVLYLVSTRSQKFSQFQFIKMNDEFQVHALGTNISSFEREIKAVTFHNLTIINTEPGFEVTITFDV
jgi:SHS2 domain-containing protein